MSNKRIDVLSTSDASGGAQTAGPHSFAHGDEFPCSLGAKVTGTVDYTVQVSNDGSTWFNHDYMVNLTASSISNITAAVAYVRLVQNSGTGSVDLTVVESRT